MDFRKELLTRIQWRKEHNEKRNTIGANISTRVKYEIELLEDLLITYDNLCVSESDNKSTDKALILSDVSISLPSDEEIREPIQNALYSTDRLTTDQCTELADGILTYLNEAGYKVIRQ